MYEGFSHETPEDLHYRKVVTIPGDYKTGLPSSYPQAMLAATLCKGVDERLLNGGANTCVVVGGTPSERTAMGVYIIQQWEQDDWRYWREGSYQRQLSILSEYREMAKKMPNRDDLTDQYMEYEREFLNLESCKYLFVDQVGAEGFWPNHSGRLINTLDDRHTASRFTVIAIAPTAEERVPEWSRFTKPHPRTEIVSASV